MGALGRVENCRPSGQYNYVHTTARCMLNDDVNFLVSNIFMGPGQLPRSTILSPGAPSSTYTPVHNFPTVFSCEALHKYPEHRPYREADSDSYDQEIPPVTRRFVTTFTTPRDSVSYERCILTNNYIYVNPLQTKRRPLYLKTQSVPCCKHFSSRL